MAKLEAGAGQGLGWGSVHCRFGFGFSLRGGEEPDECIITLNKCRTVMDRMLFIWDRPAAPGNEANVSHREPRLTTTHHTPATHAQSQTSIAYNEVSGRSGDAAHRGRAIQKSDAPNSGRIFATTEQEAQPAHELGSRTRGGSDLDASVRELFLRLGLEPLVAPVVGRPCVQQRASSGQRTTRQRCTANTFAKLSGLTAWHLKQLANRSTCRPRVEVVVTVM